MTRLIALAVAVLLVAVAGWFVCELLRSDTVCATGVQQQGPAKECTGVSDGGYSFAPALDQVSERVKAENDRITGQLHVTVALMIPLTSPNPVEQARILREVQGAYLAQYRANHSTTALAPAIRLVLANPGSDSSRWRPVADQLATMAASKTDNLRVVAGFDSSVRSTQDTITYLTTSLHIPVVGGAITASDIANNKANAYPGLARVAPTTSGEAAALASYEKSVTPDQTLVVEDVRDDDNYLNNLKEAFKSLSGTAPELFHSPADVHSAGYVANEFQQLVHNICESPTAKLIYFAGRYTQLRLFINALGARGCKDKAYTVVTGSAANTLASDPEVDWKALEGGITLRYSSLGHPDMWAKATTGGAQEDFRGLADLTDQASKGPVGPIGAVDLSDSRTMVVHDAFWTAITAIRNNTSKETPVPPLAQVADAWQRLHGSGRIAGATGWICLDNYGNPYDKALAVVELDPKHRSIRFDGLAWPEKAPPNKDCTIPEEK
ncbi:ABC transporter substrate-binding protein [Kitasatospora sp. McL0602]|uniref:ABC transporter substrate-binding protein n=1 Tax=Kitasatospora sp. McL0602 TaxID=3439530 RepID=UPI003F89580B